MIAILPIAVFFACAVLAIATLVHAWRLHGAAWLALHRELLGAGEERVIPTSAAGLALRRRSPTPTARFRAGSLRQSPALPLRVAA